MGQSHIAVPLAVNPVFRIRIQSVQWIRIRNPDTGGQKYPQKLKTINKFYFLKCWMVSFQG
jgi:hypothetical protein